MRWMVVVNIVVLTVVGLSCGRPHAPVSAAEAQRVARTYTPPVSNDPQLRVMRERFLRDRDQLQSQQLNFFAGSPIDCQLSPEFLQQFGVQGQKVLVEVLSGQCEGGQLVGPARVRWRSTFATRKNERVIDEKRQMAASIGEGGAQAAEPTGTRASFIGLDEATWENGQRVGDSRQINLSRAASSYAVSNYTYGLYDREPAPIREATFVLHAIGDTLYKTRLTGNVLQVDASNSSGRSSQVFIYYVDRRLFKFHGPTRLPVKNTMGCLDLGRFVTRTPCDPMAPPTEGVPPDLIKESVGEVGSIGDMRLALASTEVELLQPGHPDIYAGVWEIGAAPAAPVGAPVPAAGPTAPATASAYPVQPTAQPQTGSPRCPQAAAHQAEVVAGNAPSMQQSLQGTFASQCQREAWSEARIDCVLAARNAGRIEACSAIVPPAPATAQECGQAADHQANVMSKSAPSMRDTFRTSFANACASERWSKARVACVLKANNGRQFEKCAAKDSEPATAPQVSAPPAPSPKATRVQCRYAGKKQASIMLADAPSMQPNVASAVADQCLNEGWTEDRVGCVLKAKQKSDIEACSR